MFSCERCKANLIDSDLQNITDFNNELYLTDGQIAISFFCSLSFFPFWPADAR